MFSTQELCDLCCLKWQIHNNYVKERIVKPAVIGRKGKGNGHGFTLKQALGIANASPCIGLPKRHIKAMIELIEKQDEDLCNRSRVDLA
jgi:hypothetical protein